MLVISIVAHNKSVHTRTFEKREITIGRGPDNDIQLSDPNVSQRHVRISASSAGIVAVDLGSTNGTFLNGKRIDGATRVTKGQRIYVGDFTLTFEDDETETTIPPPPMAKPTSHATERRERLRNLARQLADRLGS